MITLEQYFGPHKNFSEMHRTNAVELLARVNPFLEFLLDSLHESAHPVINPKTGSQVAGETYGGWRPYACPIGAPDSAHKVGKAVDVFDPRDTFDLMVTDLMLTKFDLYREAPGATPGWLHLASRPPGSGKRTFQP